MTDPYKPPKPNLKNKLDAIAETLAVLAVTLIFATVFGLVALFRILYELQRG